MGTTSEDVLEVLVRRHVFASERPFPAVLDGIFGGISRPDIEVLDLLRQVTGVPVAATS